jgi:hypothetical protein
MSTIPKPPEILNKIVDLVLAKPKAVLKAKERTAKKRNRKMAEKKSSRPSQ